MARCRNADDAEGKEALALTHEPEGIVYRLPSEPDEQDEYAWFFWTPAVDGQVKLFLFTFYLSDELAVRLPSVDLDKLADYSWGVHGYRRDASDMIKIASSDELRHKIEFLWLVASMDGYYALDAPSVVDEVDIDARFGDDLERLGGVRPIAASKAKAQLQAALTIINTRRRQLGMAPLDPVAAGWTDEDVLLEAVRVQANPALRGQLLSWS